MFLEIMTKTWLISCMNSIICVMTKNRMLTNKIRRATQLKCCKIMVILVLLYEAKYWALYRADSRWIKFP
jgi:hypothetical protein